MSAHLDNIIKSHERASNLQVVFVDVEKYSKRKTRIQDEVINKLSLFLRTALQDVSREFIAYTQENNINLKDDTIILPTGDGAAIIFSFDGLHEIHLRYALAILKQVYELNIQTPCKQFAEAGYCNDHPHFNVRIGISQGDGLIYRDVNNHYNVAGNVINMAARVMYLADRNQIVFTSEAYSAFFEMIDRPGLDVEFAKYSQVKVKHDVIMDIYQYVAPHEYLNTIPLIVGKLAEEHSRERELLARYSQIEDAGFRKLYPNRQELFDELIESIISNSREELKILGICVSLFRESDKPMRSVAGNSSRTVENLVEIIKEGCKVKVLFLKRYLTTDERKHYGIGQQTDLYFMRERDEEFDYDFRRGRRLKILANISVGQFIRVLLELARQVRDWDADSRKELLSRLEIREYNSLPSLSLYIIDDDIYVTPYLCKRHCSTVPAFKVSSRSSTLFTAYNGHFEATWNSRDTTSTVDRRFIQLLVDEPTSTIELFDAKYQEISIQEEAKVNKKPIYHEDPERYRLEEKAIREVIAVMENSPS